MGFKADLGFLKRRVKKLRDTARELKGEFKRTKTPLLQDLYLEIECYSDEIEGRINKIERSQK